MTSAQVVETSVTNISSFQKLLSPGWSHYTNYRTQLIVNDLVTVPNRVNSHIYQLMWTKAVYKAVSSLSAYLSLWIFPDSITPTWYTSRGSPDKLFVCALTFYNEFTELTEWFVELRIITKIWTSEFWINVNLSSLCVLSFFCLNMTICSNLKDFAVYGLYAGCAHTNSLSWSSVVQQSKQKHSHYLFCPNL